MSVNKEQKGENGFSFVFVWAVSQDRIIHMCLSVLFSVGLCRPSSAVSEYNEAATQLTCPAASKRSNAGKEHIFSPDMCRKTHQRTYINATKLHTNEISLQKLGSEAWYSQLRVSAHHIFPFMVLM